jgi:NAD(P)-dependent dehydrogenase (short-subunit alcohol dehydrogenase family)
VADPEAVADAATQAEKELGAVDILINNAAVPRRSCLRCSIGGGVGS